MQKETCHWCRFWARGASFSGQADNRYGECRHDAPKQYIDNLGKQQRFPITQETEWCGQFEERVTRHEEI